MKGKSQYTILFEQLYELYVKDPSSNRTWSTIYKQLDPFKQKLVNKSSLKSKYYKEALVDVDLAIYDAFNTYDASRNCSLYSWTYRLASQTIWRFIQDKVENNPIEYRESLMDAEEFSEESIEDKNIEEEEHQRKEELLEKILRKIFRGPLEYEVFCRKNGIFGFEKSTMKEIASDTRFTEETINTILRTASSYKWKFMKYITRNGLNIDNITEEHINNFKKL